MPASNHVSDKLIHRQSANWQKFYIPVLKTENQIALLQLLVITLMPQADFPAIKSTGCFYNLDLAIRNLQLLIRILINPDQNTMWNFEYAGNDCLWILFEISCI